MIVPAPSSFTVLAGAPFELNASSRLVVGSDDASVIGVAERFAAWLRRATGFAVTVEREAAGDRDVELVADAGDDPAGEAYSLRASSRGVRVTAATPVGFFRGLTTLRQLLPAAAERDIVQDVPWTVPSVDIADRPRFAYRSVMLDVSRHFFPVDDVLKLIDTLSLFKVSHLHLHLTDDQGWRFPVLSWPKLTEVGGAWDHDGGPGGAYTEADIARLVACGAERFVEIVPEIDLPGHTRAALRAYPELTCDGEVPPTHLETDAISISLCIGRPETSTFVADVLAAVADQVPGAFTHLGADEAFETPADDYRSFLDDAAKQILSHGRRPIVWHEAAVADLPPGTVVQYWGGSRDPELSELARSAVARGLQVILSPNNLVYLDMRQEPGWPYGTDWAGVITPRVSYGWDPGSLIDGVPEESVLGIDGPLWTETVPDRAVMEHHMFPRAACIAEVGWSPASALDWEQFRQRLAAQGPRLDALGVDYFRDPEVPWPA